MYSFSRMALAPVLVTAAALLAVQSAAQERKEEPLKYPDVQKDIQKNVGKKVSWVGQQVGYQTSTDKEGRTAETYTFLWQDDKGQFFVDHPFVVKGEKLQRSAAAKKADNDPNDKSIRLVAGTIKDSQELNTSGGKKYKAPVLVDVTIDVAPAKSK